jgi:hypothetical protein
MDGLMGIRQNTDISTDTAVGPVLALSRPRNCQETENNRNAEFQMRYYLSKQVLDNVQVGPTEGGR